MSESESRDDFEAAVEALPWIAMPCPSMPHEYAVQSKSPAWAWNVIFELVSHRNPDTYRAYFRGYQSANRYWDAPDGRRYWYTRFMLNRCDPASVEPPRRVDEGAKRIGDWEGPPWAPNHSGLYERDPVVPRWWIPTAAVRGAGYRPCRSCERRLRQLGRL
jgi:hypothetical protein